ncbi:glycerol-3-phosphate 1-O-acyltransferase PlsY [Chitinimonas sp.]|uniref:glycerol-3-phosphate 1-O-acyltransferase PlsY n=1 Tax=Chitinimonas sp. TaxID=1934313 RepID=UPI0035B40A7E
MPPFAAPLLFVAAAYLIGSLSFAVIVSRLLSMADPRSYGSGNPGATNVLRSGRKLAALLTLSGDSLKAVLAIAAARQAGLPDAWLAAVAVAVTVGHMWPVFFRFHGGKGVATAAGVLLTLDWRLGLGTLLVWLLIAASSRISSLAALVAALAAPLACATLLPGQPAILVAVLIIAALLIQRHKQNLLNLIHGRESRIGDKAKS